MYHIILGVHNLVRWIVLAAGVWVLVRAWRGWMQRGAWSGGDASALRVLVYATSLQAVLGVTLYAISPLIHRGLSDMGATMRDSSVRYFVVEHAMVMLAAVALVHIGSAKVRRSTSDSAKFQTATIWVALALVAMLARIPWTRALTPSF